jgi:hypothetical protein
MRALQCEPTREALRTLWPNIEAALRWIENDGDRATAPSSSTAYAPLLLGECGVDTRTKPAPWARCESRWW